jgi:hypothetical protein
MKVKFKDLLVCCGSSIFAAICFVIISCAMIAFGFFSIALVTFIELMVQFKVKASSVIWATAGHIQSIRISLAFRQPKFKIVKRDMRLFWGRML